MSRERVAAFAEALWGSRRIAEVNVEDVQSEFTVKKHFDVEYAMLK
jgi:hypothetical protein